MDLILKPQLVLCQQKIADSRFNGAAHRNTCRKSVYNLNSGAAHRNINPIGMYFQKSRTDILLYIQFHFW